MSIEELIDLLITLPQREMEVFVAYDCMVCVDAIRTVLLVNDGEAKGLYFCARSADAAYAVETDDDYKGGIFLSVGPE